MSQVSLVLEPTETFGKSEVKAETTGPLALDGQPDNWIGLQLHRVLSCRYETREKYP